MPTTPATPEPQTPEVPVEAPQVTQPPQDLEADEGEPVTFTARIIGTPAPVVSWYRNNMLVKPSKYFRMESTPDGIHSLCMREVFPEDTGTYRCVARSKAGEVSCKADLKVHPLESEAETPQQRDVPPSFQQPITNTMVVEGHPVTFEAIYSGTPQPEIKWLRNSLQVITSTRNYKV